MACEAGLRREALRRSRAGKTWASGQVRRVLRARERVGSG